MTSWNRRLSAAAARPGVGEARTSRAEVLADAVAVGVVEEDLTALMAMANIARDRPGFHKTLDVRVRHGDDTIPRRVRDPPRRVRTAGAPDPGVPRRAAGRGGRRRRRPRGGGRRGAADERRQRRRGAPPSGTSTRPARTTTSAPPTSSTSSPTPWSRRPTWWRSSPRSATRRCGPTTRSSPLIPIREVRQDLAGRAARRVVEGALRGQGAARAGEVRPVARPAHLRRPTTVSCRSRR